MSSNPPDPRRIEAALASLLAEDSFPDCAMEPKTASADLLARIHADNAAAVGRALAAADAVGVVPDPTPEHEPHPHACNCTLIWTANPPRHRDWCASLCPVGAVTTDPETTEER